MNPKISVIVPVYNGEKYIKTCLYGLLTQTIKDIEVIVVNDGSVDSSSEIAHVIASRDKRIKVIDKKNEGVSIARNMALRIALGEWIAFSDVDDCYYPDGLANLYNIACQSHCRIIMGNTNRIDKNGVISQRYSFRKHGHIYNTFPIGSLEMWGDLFHKSLFNSESYQFHDGLAYLEDRYLMIKLLSREGKYAVCSTPVYAHVKNDDSVLESKDGLKMAKHCLWASRLMLDYAENANYFRPEVISDSEKAKKRAFSYFFKKKNATISELRDVYSNYFKDGFVKYVAIELFESTKLFLKKTIKAVI